VTNKLKRATVRRIRDYMIARRVWELKLGLGCIKIEFQTNSRFGIRVNGSDTSFGQEEARRTSIYSPD
jgi:hypothetical protein